MSLGKPFSKEAVGWPAGSDAKTWLIICKEECWIAGCEKGIFSQVSRYQPKYPDTNLWIAAMVESKHMSIMDNTWIATFLKAKHNHCIRQELVEIN